MKSENHIFIKNIIFKIKIINNNQTSIFSLNKKLINPYCKKMSNQTQKINSKTNTPKKVLKIDNKLRFKNKNDDEIKHFTDINYSNETSLDALFSIKRIIKMQKCIYLIEIKQNDISQLLKVYSEKNQFDLEFLLNYCRCNFKKKILETLLDKAIIYPIFKLTKETEDDKKDIGIIKLNKGY